MDKKRKNFFNPVILIESTITTDRLESIQRLP
jgi:hypothetical protein